MPLDEASKGTGPMSTGLGTITGGAGLPDWNPELDDVLVCRQVRQETADVKTFVFSARKPCLFRFKPGQFLTLELSIGGETIHRSYTISSSAARPYRLSITVKRVPGGPVSNWLHDTLKPGDEIRAVGPMGDFTLPETGAASTKYLFLSGGSGITPSMSMTRTLADLGEDTDIVFIHAARSPSDVIFRHELDLMARHAQRLRVAHTCEALTGEPGWPGFTGRVSLAMLQLMAPDLMERTVYVCGPSPFMAAVRSMLEGAGFDMARYNQESFNFEELGLDAQPSAPEAAPAEAAPVPEAAAPVAAATFKVAFAKTGKTIDCSADTTILDAARRSGVRLPASCARGLCGTCKSKKVSGEVTMKHAGGIRQREIDQGQILLCCSKPTSDLVIDR